MEILEGEIRLKYPPKSRARKRAREEEKRDLQSS